MSETKHDVHQEEWFIVETTWKGANDWNRHSATTYDSVEAAQAGIKEARNAAFEFRIAKVTTVTEVIEPEAAKDAYLQQMLDDARDLQGQFWDALRELEGALDGLEIDANDDLEHVTIEHLKELMAAEETSA